MRTLLIDPFHGAAGDMIIGALLSLIDEPEIVLQTMASVVAAPNVETVQRCGITALKVHTNATMTHRTAEEVTERIESANAPEEVIAFSLRVFNRIVRAETRVHGRYTTADSEAVMNMDTCTLPDHHEHHHHHVYFHEVGADDAIADIIGSSMAFHLLSPDRIVILPVATGRGTVMIEHGIVPVPAPATAVILSESALITHFGGGEGELLTPTGAAILAEAAGETMLHNGNEIIGTITRIGYGAGSRDDPLSPNVIRMMLIEEKSRSSDEHHHTHSECV